jgi:[ribosomal protein S5]-alanine N-acetyltransferase
VSIVRLPIVTDRLELRPFEASDAERVHSVYSDPEVMRHVGEGPVADIATTRAMLADYVAHQREYGFSFWALIESASGALIGDAGLYLQKGSGPEVELGFTLGRPWWGRGYATEAGEACLAFAFDQVRLAEAVAVADLVNAASQRVLEKLGMARAGTRTAYGREHAFYRMTARAWRTR